VANQASATIESLIPHISAEEDSEMRDQVMEVLAPIENLADSEYILAKKKSFKATRVKEAIEGFRGETLDKVHVISVGQRAFHRIIRPRYLLLVRDSDYMNTRQSLKKSKGPNALSHVNGPLQALIDNLWEAFLDRYQKPLGGSTLTPAVKSTITHVVTSYVLSANACDTRNMMRFAPLLEVITQCIPVAHEGNSKTWHLLVD